MNRMQLRWTGLDEREPTTKILQCKSQHLPCKSKAFHSRREIDKCKSSSVHARSLDDTAAAGMSNDNRRKMTNVITGSTHAGSPDATTEAGRSEGPRRKRVQCAAKVWVGGLFFVLVDRMAQSCNKTRAKMATQASVLH